jgi:hypothetical protein
LSFRLEETGTNKNSLIKDDDELQERPILGMLILKTGIKDKKIESVNYELLVSHVVFY